VVKVFSVVMAEDTGRWGPMVGSVDEGRGGEDIVTELHELDVSGFHAIEGLGVGYPTDGFHSRVIPVVLFLQVGLEGGFTGSVVNGGRIRGVDGASANMQLGEVSREAWNLGSVGLE
jgi:hypothetical protein